MASCLVAYILWLCGGWFGLHHYYLKRPYHTFTWLTTGGGFIGGWLWDLFKIPTYVEEACVEPAALIPPKRLPRCSTTRYIGQILLGNYFGYLSAYALPKHLWDQSLILDTVLSGLVGAAIGWGVHVVGNIGLQQRKLISALESGIFCCAVLSIIGFRDSYSYTTLACAYWANRTVQWRTTRPQISGKTLLCWITIYYAAWGSLIFTNVEVSVNGRLITVGTLLRGADWSSIAHKLKDFASYLHRTDWLQVSEDFRKWLRNFLLTFTVASSQEFDDAYEILQLDSSASTADIRRKCRLLMKEYHPDRVHTDEEKEAAQETFMKVEHACDMLIKGPNRRSRANRDDL